MFGLTQEPGTLHFGIEIVALSLEVFAIGLIAVGIVYGTIRFLSGMRVPENRMGVYHAYKNQIGRTLLLGLEILVAADIIRTIALDPTLQSVAVLGLLVLIRTFLSWSLVVEIEGR